MLSLSSVSSQTAGFYYGREDYYFNRETGGIGEVILGASYLGKEYLNEREFKSITLERLFERALQKTESQLQKLENELSSLRSDLEKAVGEVKERIEKQIEEKQKEIEQLQERLSLIEAAATDAKAFSEQIKENFARERGISAEKAVEELKREFQKYLEEKGLYYDKATGNILPSEIQEMEKQARIATDITFSAPKSVSLIAALGNPEQREEVIQAHREAVQAVMEYIKESGMVQTRISRDGQTFLSDVDRESIVAVRFDHFTNRNAEPHLHSHCLLANTVKDQEGNSYSTYLYEIYKNKEALGALYRQELASRLQELGYQIEWKEKGLFEIKGFTEEQLKAFSTRRQEIEQYMKEKGLEGGKAAEVATLETRQAKKEYDKAALRELWEKKAAELNIQIPSPERNQEERLTTDKEVIEKMVDVQDKLMIAEKIADKQIHTAGFTNYNRVELELAKTLCYEGKTAGVQEIRDLARKGIDIIAESHGGKVTIDRDFVQRERITTENILHSEFKSYVVGIRDNQVALDSEKARATIQEFNNRLEKEKSFRLDKTQSEIAEKIATSTTDAVIEGKAGAGKTTLMEMIKDIYENQGKQVLGIAPTGTAAKNLHQEAGIKSYTADALAFIIDNEKMVEKLKGNVGLVIVDEAGMLDSTRAALVQDFAKEIGAKILWVGDRSQLQPVQSGTPFWHLASQAYEKGSYYTLTEVYRQKHEGYKEACVLAGLGKMQESFQKFQELGWVKEVNTQKDLIKNVVTDYINKTMRGENVLVVTETRTLADKINKEVRFYLKQNGEISKDGIITQVKNTDGQKIGEREFCLNDKVIFLRNNKELGVTNGMTGNIIGINKEQNTLKVELNDGRQVTIDLNKYNYLNHSYCITVHKSQGMTVDKVIYVSDSKNVNSNLYYVAISRGREEATIYVKDIEKFKEKIAEAARKVDVFDMYARKRAEEGAMGKELLEQARQGNIDGLREIYNVDKGMNYKPEDDIKTSISMSANREAWQDLDKKTKQELIKEVVTGEKAQEEVKGKYAEKFAEKVTKELENRGIDEKIIQEVETKTEKTAEKSKRIEKVEEKQEEKQQEKFTEKSEKGFKNKETAEEKVKTEEKVKQAEEIKQADKVRTEKRSVGSFEEKSRIQEKGYTKTNQQQYGIINKIDRAITHTGLELIAQKLANHFSGKGPSLKMQLKHGYTLANYYCALKNGEYIKARIWGGIAGLDGQRIETDIAVLKAIKQGKEPGFGFFLINGKDATALVLAAKAVKQNDIKLAVKAAVLNSEVGFRAMDKIITKKIENFIKDLGKKTMAYMASKALEKEKAGVMDKERLKQNLKEYKKYYNRDYKKEGNYKTEKYNKKSYRGYGRESGEGRNYRKDTEYKKEEKHNKYYRTKADFRDREKYNDKEKEKDYRKAADFRSEERFVEKASERLKKAEESQRFERETEKAKESQYYESKQEEKYTEEKYTEQQKENQTDEQYKEEQHKEEQREEQKQKEQEQHEQQQEQQEQQQEQRWGLSW